MSRPCDAPTPKRRLDHERGRFRDLVLRQLRKIGIDDVEKRIRFERIITPADWEIQHQIYRGATFNLARSGPDAASPAAESF